jgi:hypothetical protein
MNIGNVWLIASTLLVVSSSIISASNTNVTFNEGPFHCSLDLGTNCSDVEISRPIHNQLPDGTGYDHFNAKICGVAIALTHYNKSIFDLDKGVSTQSIFGDLISLSADSKTIQLYSRIIDGQNGAVGSANIPRYETDVYDASYLISPESVCRITVWGASNYNKMKSTMDTIHVEERS